MKGVVCYVKNIPEVLLPWQVSQVFDAVFILINNDQTDSKTKYSFREMLVVTKFKMQM